MADEIRTWLLDTIGAIEEIELFVNEIDDFSNFQSDVKLQRAVERNIEIIGEAIGRILKREPDYVLKDSRKIVDTRNRIIHGYDSVSPYILWTIIKHDLPALKTQITKLVN